ncbi:rhodanese-like domain-containing protein [Leptolyngbya sp. CCY15150]|uniref:sulfurtransferase n=1 Tax=Leptolyngbya sp. CCY15150 TaxID=2767772 RepID=UPI0019514EE9|nr:rhodanese-like domain-containing protein [Leptolyngbya sp. CCY15150]
MARRDQRQALSEETYPWIVTWEMAYAYLHQGATLLDARGKTWTPRFSKVRRIQWQWFTPHEPTQRGCLLNQDVQLSNLIHRLGITDAPVLVVGDAHHGWGQEGRIVWMLRSLGHPAACWVDGGWAALPSQPIPQTPPSCRPTLSIERVPTWTIDRETLRHLITQPGGDRPWVVLDVRTLAEYQGALLHGECRGGHLPGALHLDSRDCLTPQGYLRSAAEIGNRLAQHGITRQHRIITYCTGGIRSAWMTTVLVQLGYVAQNYAGSMWEWSAGAAQDYPLVCPK